MSEKHSQYEQELGMLQLVDTKYRVSEAVKDKIKEVARLAETEENLWQKLIKGEPADSDSDSDNNVDIEVNHILLKIKKKLRKKRGNLLLQKQQW